MATEWLAPTITGAVGVVGIVATSLTARGGRKDAERAAKGRMKHERDLAEDARRQLRLADAYVELLGIVTRVAHFADSVRPMFNTNPPAPLPPLPSTDEQGHAEALVLAYGSRNVRELYERWRASVQKIIVADDMLKFAETSNAPQGNSGLNIGEIYQELHQELKPAQRSAQNELVEAIGVELRSRPPREP